MTGTNPATLGRARAELGGIAEIIASDAGDADAVRRLFARVAERAGGLDVLILNVGILGGGSIVDMPEDVFDAILRINLKGPWLALKAAIPLLRRGGAVVMNGAINSHLGMPGTSAYSASKGALRSLARVAASELAPRGVRVNVVSPGPTDSGIVEKLMAERRLPRSTRSSQSRFSSAAWGPPTRSRPPSCFLRATKRRSSPARSSSSMGG